MDTDEGDVMSQGKRKASAYDAAEELSETEGKDPDSKSESFLIL